MEKNLRKVVRGVAVAMSLVLATGFSVGALKPDAEAAATEFDDRLVIGALSVCFALALLGFYAVRALNWWLPARRRTALTAGTVVGRSGRESPSDGAMMYQRVLHVQYFVRKRRHELEWTPSHFHTNISWLLERIDAKYPNGAEVRVRYEPGNAENAWVGRAWGAPLIALPLSAALFAAALVSGYLTGSFATQLWSAPSAHETARASSSRLSSKVGEGRDVGAVANEGYEDIPCSCISEVNGRDERVQLARRLEPSGLVGAAPRARYRLHIGVESAVDLPPVEGAPLEQASGNVAELAVACWSGRLIVAQGNWITAWSLTRPSMVWSTRTPTTLNLLLRHGSAPRGGVACRELDVHDGAVAVPIGKGKNLAVALATGSIIGVGAAKRRRN